MKGLFSALFFILAFSTFATKPPQKAPVPDTALVQLASDTVQQVTSIPDSICVTVNDAVVCVPTKDGAEAGRILQDFIESQKGHWPKDVWGIILLIGGFLLSAQGAMFLSNATKVYRFLKIFLRETLHVVVFISMVFAAAITFLVGYFQGKGFSFDWQIFAVLSPTIALGAVYIYERRLKKQEAQKASQV